MRYASIIPIFANNCGKSIWRRNVMKQDQSLIVLEIFQCPSLDWCFSCCHVIDLFTLAGGKILFHVIDFLEVFWCSWDWNFLVSLPFRHARSTDAFQQFCLRTFIFIWLQFLGIFRSNSYKMGAKCITI